MFNPLYPKSHFDLVNLAFLGLQLVLFCVFPLQASRVFFFFYFAFWRAAYDVGLGWVLTKQSKKKWIVKEVQRLGWLDEKRKPEARDWIRKQLAGKMGKDYSFDVRPIPIRQIMSLAYGRDVGTATGVQYLAPLPTGRRHHFAEVRGHFCDRRTDILMLTTKTVTSLRTACLLLPVSVYRKVCH